MIGLLIEFTFILAVFGWLYWRQLRERKRDRRLPPLQLPLDLRARSRREQ